MADSDSTDVVRNVLVTGASSGFGRLTVETLARRGHTAFAAVRDPEGRNRPAVEELTALAADEGIDIRTVALDVTDQESVDRGIAAALAAADHLDAVVNNAGGVFPGPLESFDDDQFARQFDLNVIGAHRVARAVLPHLRARGRGVLIQMGSVSSQVTVPYTGLYGASKAALASLTEAWHDELAPFGVEAVIVEATSYPTRIGDNAVMPADLERMSAYNDGFTRFFAAAAQHPAQSGDPQVVADAIVALVEAPEGGRPLRTVVAPDVEAEALRRLDTARTEAVRTISGYRGLGDFIRR